MSQQKLKRLSVKQKLANNEEEIINLKDQIRVKGDMVRMKDKAVPKLQQDLKEYRKVTQKQLSKISTLQKEVAEKDEEIVVTRNEMSDLHHQLAQQSGLLSVV